MNQKNDSILEVISRVDTLYIDRVDPLYNEAYIKLLEKSNEQLSLVGNPLAWMIGALGILFTVGAIMTAYLLWRQSKDFKEEQTKLLRDASTEITNLQSQLKKQSEVLINRLATSVDEIDKRRLTLNEEDNESLNKKVEALKSELELIKNNDFRNITIDDVQSAVLRKEISKRRLANKRENESILFNFLKNPSEDDIEPI